MRHITTPVRAKVQQPYRELLQRYLVLINNERRRRGLRPVTAAEVAGAMICLVLDQHQQSILEAYEANRTDIFAKKFGSLLGDEPDTAARTAPLPES